ncbi:hypothetical protein [Iningainema tapete]|uniref:Uncharacterized protein n=1 Tax=Iningainema tapete BLCC-T55 TaxID=2748662 RepID=A0A8J7BWS5_9CYAN|nr:hypothetical protein [Iningainema tapete]MBD2772367.1 hypothetical protein [Iningainema tapete BLCC-T55]
MKRVTLLSLSMGLTVLSVGLLTKIQYTSAQPASVFQPILSDIRNQLPKGTEIRLPSTLPTFNRSLLFKAFSDIPVDGNIYPYISSNNEAITVNFAVSPNCASAAKPDGCSFGGIGVFKDREPKFWPPKGENITPVDLGNGISGYYLTRGSGYNTLRYVFWKQNGLTFALGSAAFALSQQQIIDTAISAVNEPPITSN